MDANQFVIKTVKNTGKTPSWLYDDSMVDDWLFLITDTCYILLFAKEIAIALSNHSDVTNVR